MSRSVFLLAVTLLVCVMLSCADRGPKEVEVTLREWSIVARVEETKSGRLRFVATNQGSMAHQLAVFKSDLPPDQLPLVAGIVDETKANFQAKLNLINPGTTERFEVGLSPGKYVLLCNLVSRDGGTVVNHYENGMSASFFVHP